VRQELVKESAVCSETVVGNGLYRRLLASRTGVDETAIWEWGFLERVSTGLYVLEFGDEHLTRRFLDTAEMLA
jgi:hypothetical protein